MSRFSSNFAKACQTGFRRVRQIFKRPLDNSNELNEDSNPSTFPSIISCTKDVVQCAICLDAIYLRATTNSCLHQFCFPCITKWSYQNDRCPLCKVYFQEIYYNFRPGNDHDIKEIGLSYFPRVLRSPRVFITPYLDCLFKAYEFRHSSARKFDFMLTPTGNFHFINPFDMQVTNILYARFDISGTDLRIQHYELYDFVDPFPLTLDSDYKFCSTVDFIRSNPRRLNTLAIFLHREINAVLRDTSSFVKSLFLDLILHFVGLYETSSDFFFEFLYIFIPENARQFRHELTNILLCDLSIDQYDMFARYSFRNIVEKRDPSLKENMNLPVPISNKRRDMLHTIDKLVAVADLLNKYTGGTLLQRYPTVNLPIVWKIRFDNIIRHERMQNQTQRREKKTRRGSI